MDLWQGRMSRKLQENEAPISRPFAIWDVNNYPSWVIIVVDPYHTWIWIPVCKWFSSTVMDRYMYVYIYIYMYNISVYITCIKIEIYSLVHKSSNGKSPIN